MPSFTSKIQALIHISLKISKIHKQSSGCRGQPFVEQKTLSVCEHEKISMVSGLVSLYDSINVHRAEVIINSLNAKLLHWPILDNIYLYNKRRSDSGLKLELKAMGKQTCTLWYLHNSLTLFLKRSHFLWGAVMSLQWPFDHFHLSP